MIKAVIFDFGGVISKSKDFDWLSKKFSEFYNIESAEISKKWIEEIVSPLFKDIVTGKVSVEILYEKSSKFFNVEKNKHKEDWLILVDEYNFEIIELIKSLEGRYRLAILSNITEGLIEQFLDKHSLNDKFEVVIKSFEVGLMKPDLKIYELILNKLNLKAEECLFVDDLEKNVKAAKKIGMQAIQFKGNIKEIKNKLN